MRCSVESALRKQQRGMWQEVQAELWSLRHAAIMNPKQAAGLHMRQRFATTHTP